MTATTETEPVRTEGPESETGGTANLNTTPRRVSAPGAAVAQSRGVPAAVVQASRPATEIGSTIMSAMKPSRLAAWIFGAAVCGAWLASAAGVARQPRPVRTAPRANSDVQLDALAADVQAQAGRLRQRLATAPAPEGIDRNPFTFSARQAPVRRAALPPEPVVVPAAAIPEVREPVLELIGVAEDKKDGGFVRTAMITGGHDELMMVGPGQRVLGRYEVVAVGADAVELKDLETGAIRRLVLR